MTHRGRKSRFDHIHPSVLRPKLVAAPTHCQPPPDHLQPPEAAIWEHVIRDFQLPAIAVDVLRVSLEAHARARLAREAIDRDGMTVTGRDGQVKSHPLLGVERDARAAFLAGVKQLGLDQVRDGPSFPSPWADAS